VSVSVDVCVTLAVDEAAWDAAGVDPEGEPMPVDTIRAAVAAMISTQMNQVLPEIPVWLHAVDVHVHRHPDDDLF